MGGDISRITPEWKAFMARVASEATSRVPLDNRDLATRLDEHEEWRRLNLGTDR